MNNELSRTAVSWSCLMFNEDDGRTNRNYAVSKFTPATLDRYSVQALLDAGLLEIKDVLKDGITQPAYVVSDRGRQFLVLIYV